MSASSRAPALVVSLLAIAGCENDPTCTTNAREVEIAAQETIVACSLDGKTLRITTNLFGCSTEEATCTFVVSPREGPATLVPSLVSRTCAGEPLDNSCGEYARTCTGTFPGAGTYQIDRAENAEPLVVTIGADGSCTTS